MAQVEFVVYAPPTVGLPYLAVMIEPDGKVTTVGFGSLIEAEAHVAAEAAKVGEKSTNPRNRTLI